MQPIAADIIVSLNKISPLLAKSWGYLLRGTTVKVKKHGMKKINIYLDIYKYP
jgi:hypothetical protein